MRFKLDENTPLELAELLRSFGYDSITVYEERLKGSSDARLAAVCRQERRAFITFDRHFADIRNFPPNEYPGILVLRLQSQDPDRVVAVFNRVIPLLKQRSPDGQLWIVEEDRVRVRQPE